MPYRLAFLSPHPDLTEQIQGVLEKSGEIAHLVTARWEEGFSGREELKDERVVVYLTTYFWKRSLEDYTGKAVVPIGPGYLETFMALYHATEQFKQPVAFFEYAQAEPLPPFCFGQLKQEVYRFSVVGPADLADQVRAARERGLMVAVGDAVIGEVARQVGMQFCQILFERQEIQKSLEKGQLLARLIKMERREWLRLKTIINSANVGLIVVDGERRVSMINEKAREVLGSDNDEVVGRLAGKVWPNFQFSRVMEMGLRISGQLEDYGNGQILVDYIPILEKERVVGAVASFQDIHSVQHSEEHIRREVRERKQGGGFSNVQYHFKDIIGKNNAFRQVVERARSYSRTEETILLLGETGVGKELFAQSMHAASRRAQESFVALNCAALTDSLLESELFGYADGAFTGAQKGGKAGLFEVAHKGTIFLDEIGEIAPEVQVKLLRVLQEKEIMRVGNHKIIPVNVRVIAATNRNLYEEVKKGNFRSDLFYRLSVLELMIPPLRDRLEDIPLLVEGLLERDYHDLPLPLKKDILNSLGLLQSYNWPGNVRELENFIRRLVAVLGHQPLTELSQVKLYVDNLFGQIIRRAQQLPQTVEVELAGNLKETLERLEQSIIMRNYYLLGGNKSKMAKNLGIGRSTLWRKLNELGLG